MGIEVETILKTTESVGGKCMLFSQSKITAKFRKRDMELHPGGICLALSIFYLSKKDGAKFNDLVVGVYTKDLDDVENRDDFSARVRAIMDRQNHIKKGESGTERKHFLETFVPYVEWMQELAPQYGLTLVSADTHSPVTLGKVVGAIKSSASGFVVGFGGAGAGHAIAARNDTKNIAFFDPNVGSFYIPTEKFADWFLEYMFDAEYCQKYKNIATIAELA